MRQIRMVPLTSVGDTFHGRVIAARLGAEGLVTELRGNVDGPYPMGDVHVYVGEDDLPVARELLMADEVESAFEAGVHEHEVERRPSPELWLVVAAILAAASVILVRAF